MVNYPNMAPNPVFLNNNGDRFVVPFLTGALVGGAAIGLTRPRPVYVSQPAPYYPPYPAPYPNYAPYPPYYGRPYSNVSYNYSSMQ